MALKWTEFEHHLSQLELDRQSYSSLTPVLGWCLPLKLYQLVPISKRERKPAAAAVVSNAAVLGVPTELQVPIQTSSSPRGHPGQLSSSGSLIQLRRSQLKNCTYIS